MPVRRKSINQNKPVILIAMIEAGGAHKTTAVAVAESLYKNYADKIHVEIYDFCYHVGAVDFDNKHKAQWDSYLAQKSIVKIGFHIQNSLGSITRQYLKSWGKEFFEKGVTWLRDNPPDVFFTTHFLAAGVALEARKLYPELHFPVILFNCEPHDSSSLWVWKGVDFFIVSSITAANLAILKGMKKEKIRIAQFPVRESFFNIQKTRVEICGELGIDPRKRTLLMAAGGQGRGAIEKLSKEMALSGVEMNLIVVCGKNEKLKADLDALRKKGTGKTTFVALGFVNNMNELMAASDVVGTKAGPATSYEAAYLGKPLAFIDYVENERATMRYFIDNGMGWIADSRKKLIHMMEKITQSPDYYDKLRRRIMRMSLNNGSDDIARFLNTVMETWSDREQ
jgi:UDP-N-acetylglucosamine:LPS N-acetylglucosamine transferase